MIADLEYNLSFQAALKKRFPKVQPFWSQVKPEDFMKWAEFSKADRKRNMKELYKLVISKNKSLQVDQVSDQKDFESKKFCLIHMKQSSIKFNPLKKYLMNLIEIEEDSLGHSEK